MSQRESKRLQQRLQGNTEELCEVMARAVPEAGAFEVFPCIFLARSAKPTEQVHSVFTPAFCVIAQGSKQVLLGGEVFRYDPGHYLISTVDLPIVSQVVEASEGRPYFSFRLDLDAATVASVMMESEIRIRRGDASVKAMNVSSTHADLLDGVFRLTQ